MSEHSSIKITASYPPPKHLLRDLGISITFKGREQASLRAPVGPEVRGVDGAIRPGVLATLTDVLAGSLTIRAIYPDWIATSDLSLFSTRAFVQGTLVARGTLLRAGRTRVFIETEIFEESEGATASAKGMFSDAGIGGQGPAPIGYGIVTVARIPQEGQTMPAGLDEEAGSTLTFTAEGSGLKKPILEQIGLKVLDARAGVVEVELLDYLKNSFGALQGGTVSILAEVAGECAGQAVSSKPLLTRNLRIQYLSQGRVGPFRTRARVLYESGDSVLTRVEVVDCGDDNRLVAIALNTSAGPS